MLLKYIKNDSWWFVPSRVGLGLQGTGFKLEAGLVTALQINQGMATCCHFASSLDLEVTGQRANGLGRSTLWKMVIQMRFS